MSEQQSLDEIWAAVVEAIRATGQYSETTLNLWFSDMQIKMLTENRVVLLARSPFKRDVVIKNYLHALDNAFFAILGFHVELDLRVADSEKAEVDALVNRRRAHSIIFGSSESQKEEDANEEKKVNEEEPSYYSSVGDSRVVNYAELSRSYRFEYTFDTFVVGSSNKFAHAACKAVANNPAFEYNPLFIYGPSGLGKTHLLYAITDQIHHSHPELNIVYVKGEEFTNQLIDSISKNKGAEFRERYRRADVLMIDDIQFIAGKEATQEEFFHTFNGLYENHKQIILTSDRPPRDIKTLEERLKSRFEWGLIADIKPPDFELRTAILKKKANMLNLRLNDDVLNYIAENLKSNIRQLEGAVKKIGAQSFLSGQPITIDLAISCIADLITPSEPMSVTVDKIIDRVATQYGVTIEDMKSKKRNANIANARHVAIYIIRKMTDMSLPAIAKVFNRDHTTIMSSLDKIETECKLNAEQDLRIRELIKLIQE